MLVHADLTLPALSLPRPREWVPSPLPGVERQMLERDGGEVARATSLVRYAAGSRFDAHAHALGEEFLVLEGVFSDASGHHRPGTYVRNPPGSSHAPWSEGGCIIFVKLRQSDPADLSRVVVDTRDATLLREEPAPGVRRLPLHAFGTERVAMLELAPGAAMPLDEGFELLVTDGEAEVDAPTADGRLARIACPRLSWMRDARDLPRMLRSATGARVWIKTGHLPAA